MKLPGIALMVCLAAMPLGAGQPEPTDHPDYEVVKAVIEDSIGWAMTKDAGRLFQIFADDEDLFIWWVSSKSGADGIDDLRR